MTTTITIDLADESATMRLGEDIALTLRPGDVVLLDGDLGAGKTTLARAILRAVANDDALDVPSPTFTLVQSYALRLPVHHLDLYRIGAADEIDELGIDEMASDGVVLVEWPERGGGRLPPAALTIKLEEAGSGRRATIGGDAKALARLERSLAIRAFLADAGWGDARRRHLLGDASTRAYETARSPYGELRIVMNAPRQPDGPPIRDGKPYSQIAHLAESVTAFVAVDEVLRERGFAAPEIFAADLDAGILLTEHLGAQPFLDAAGAPVAERYAAAATLLAAIHAHAWPSEVVTSQGVRHMIPAYDRGAMTIEVELLLDWYLPHVAGRTVDEALRRDFLDAWNVVFDRLAAAETSIVLRDYHSPNLIWREDRERHDRLGLIDFQDAMIGPAAYDVASLGQDARVDIPPELEAGTVAAYCAARAGDASFDREAFAQAYAIMAAQRNSKILGIFVRLDRRDGKPAYLRHLPRIRSYLSRALVHPALKPVADLYLREGVIDAPGA